MQAERTRGSILQAAQRMFSTKGYAESGVRDIAALAGVNSALISRYFGSKAELFRAALEASMDVTRFTDIPKERFGEAVADLFRDAEGAESYPIPMLVLAAADSQARDLALAVLAKSITKPLEVWLGGEAAAQKAVQLEIVVTGFLVYRHMLPQDPIRVRLDDKMHAWLARTFQGIIDA
jgi:AcrR family transcriptional regulator